MVAALTKRGAEQLAAQLDRQRREYPKLAVVSPDFMNAAADVLAASRRLADLVAEAGKLRASLDTNTAFFMIEDARLQLAKIERELVRLLYRQERA